MKYILTNIFEFTEIRIRMVAMQKQKGSNICLLYAIAATTAIVHGENQSDLQFKEDQTRNHLCRCFEDEFLTTFSTL